MLQKYYTTVTLFAIPHIFIYIYRNIATSFLFYETLLKYADIYFYEKVH